MEWSLHIQLLGFGLLAGVLGGLLGIGGGIIYVLILPAALLKLGVNPNEVVAFTVANSLFSTIFTTLSANFRQAGSNQSQWRAIFIIGLTGTILSLLLLHFVVNSLSYSRKWFDMAFLTILGYMMIRLGIKVYRQSVQKEWPKDANESNLALATTGLAAGVVSPLTGLGGGLVIVPILHSILHFPIRRANAISLGAIGLTALASSIFNLLGQPESVVSTWQVGFIIFPVAVSLSLGGICGAFAGVELGKKLKSQTITILFALFLGIIFAKKVIEIVSS